MTRLILVTLLLMTSAAVCPVPFAGGLWIGTALAQDSDDDDNDGDDDGDGDDAGGGGGGGGGGGAAAPGDGSDEVSVDDGDNIGPRDNDDCFEEAMLRPPWLRRCDDRPAAKPRAGVSSTAVGGSAASSGGSGSRDRQSAGLPGGTVAQSVVGPEPANALPREIVASGLTEADLSNLTARGFTIVARTAEGDFVRLRVPSNLSTEAARALARQIAPNAVIDFNHIYRLAQAAACTTEVCRQREAIKWPAPAGGCAVEARIGMVDTSIDPQHPALKGQSIEVIDGVSGNRPPASNAHGTAIAALMAGRDDVSAPGLLPRAKLVVVQAFHRSANGEEIADTFDIARAIDALGDRGVGVTNLSFTGPHNRVLAEVVRQTIGKGVAVVAAAGNLGPTGPVVYPAGYESVVAVTAVGTDLRVYRGANRGSHIDFSAPGVNVQVVAQREATRFESGTSYAAPFVSAALGALRARQPGASIGDLVATLQSAATDLGRPGRDPVFGWGLVQVPEAACQ